MAHSTANGGIGAWFLTTNIYTNETKETKFNIKNHKGLERLRTQRGMGGNKR